MKNGMNTKRKCKISSLYPAKVTNGEKTTYNLYMVKKDKTFLPNYQSNKLPK